MIIDGLSKIKDAVRAVMLIAFCCLVLANCAVQSNVASLRAPLRLIEYSVHPQTLYSMLTYHDNASTITTLRNDRGDLVVSLVVNSSGVLVQRPDQEDLLVDIEFRNDLEDEVLDVYRGDQRTFSVVAFDSSREPLR